MHTLILLALLVVYLAIGCLVVKRMGFDSLLGEVFACLAFLWPVLLAGIGIRVALKRVGLYHEYLEYIFTAVVALLVLILFTIYAGTLFRG